MSNSIKIVDRERNEIWEEITKADFEALLSLAQKAKEYEADFLAMIQAGKRIQNGNFKDFGLSPFEIASAIMSGKQSILEKISQQPDIMLLLTTLLKHAHLDEPPPTLAANVEP